MCNLNVRKESGAEKKLFEEIMSKVFQICWKSELAQLIPGRLNIKETIVRYLKVKLLKTKYRKKIWKQRKDNTPYKG